MKIKLKAKLALTVLRVFYPLLASKGFVVTLRKRGYRVIETKTMVLELSQMNFKEFEYHFRQWKSIHGKPHIIVQIFN